MRVEWQTSLPGPELPRGEVHLWTADAGAEPHGIPVLSDDERTHAARFRFDDDRRRWSTSRALLRMVLGRYLASDPRTVELTTVARGRPAIRRPEGSAWLSFSPARSDRLCVVVVAREVGVGVDVERVRADHDIMAIARRALGDDFALRLETLSDEQRVRAFYQAWVREEAKGKCRGTGIVEPDDPVRLVSAYVTDLDLGNGYAGALASDVRPDIIRGWATED